MCRVRGRDIGMIFQEPMTALNPLMTIGEQVAETVRVHRAAGRAEARAIALATLERVGLPNARFPPGRYPHELSGGQRQRVGVARALAADPSIVLLDEPFGALDVITRTNLQREFSRLVRDLGKTAVFVTHDLHEAMILGSRIALMEAGRIVFLDSPEQFRLSAHPLAKAFLRTIE